MSPKGGSPEEMSPKSGGNESEGKFPLSTL